MRDHPIHGVKKAKRRLPKLPASPEAHDLEELSSQYLQERNAAMRAKRLAAEMTLAQQRGELIEKKLATRQAAYLLIGFRQKALRLPHQLRVKFGPEVITEERFNYLKELVDGMLTELAYLPNTVQPDWLERLEEEKG
jgi:hypothetical protein